ncbi:hypothetical protein BgiBS90_021388 [Biomphalaria glabrata]|nr:hypothetical protein BgiBS90_021388 [Biomphalaria glabrata]
MNTTMDTSCLQWILQWIRPVNNEYYNGYVLSPMDTTIDTSCLQWILQWIRPVSNGYYNGYVLSPMDTSCVWDTLCVFSDWLSPLGPPLCISTSSYSKWKSNVPRLQVVPVIVVVRTVTLRTQATPASSSGDCCRPDCNTPHTRYACK